MRASGDETTIMSRSFLTKKYSHCPLKKRPVQFIKEENFGSGLSDGNLEPENLSTKPEDLSCKTLILPPTVTFISVKNEPHHQDKNEQPDIPSTYIKINNHSNLNHFLVKSSGGPLEPLNLNTSVNQHHYNTSATTPFPRAVPAQYPPHYIPLNYVHPLQSNLLSSPYYYSSPSSPHLPQAPLSPHSSHCERKNAPLEHAFTPFHIHHSVPMRSSSTVLPYYPASSESRPARDPQLGEHSPLSPSSTSSTSSFPFFPDRSPPDLCPEDLSSPGSVSSESSSGGGSNSRKSKSRESAPRFLCSFCSKSYSTCSGLSKHEQFHCSANEDAASKKKFKCKFCEKEYNSLGALKMHIRTHTLPCKCKLCGKAFSRPWLLQGHIRTHTGEKPFSCPHCNRAFADRSNLRAHLQTHSDVKKYSCGTCNKTFSRMSLLSKHLESGCPGVNAGMTHFTTNTNVTSCCVQVNN